MMSNPSDVASHLQFYVLILSLISIQLNTGLRILQHRDLMERLNLLERGRDDGARKPCCQPDKLRGKTVWNYPPGSDVQEKIWFLNGPMFVADVTQTSPWNGKVERYIYLASLNNIYYYFSSDVYNSDMGGIVKYIYTKADQDCKTRFYELGPEEFDKFVGRCLSKDSEYNGSIKDGYEQDGDKEPLYSWVYAMQDVDSAWLRMENLVTADCKVVTSNIYKKNRLLYSYNNTELYTDIPDQSVFDIPAYCDRPQ